MLELGHFVVDIVVSRPLSAVQRSRSTRLKFEKRNDSFKEQDHVELKRVFKVLLLSAFFNAISKMAALLKYEMIAVSSSTTIHG